MFVRNVSRTFYHSNFEIPGHDLVWANLIFNSKQRGICVYYRNSLPSKILDISYLQKCIVFELKMGNKFYKIVSLYRSPSQSQGEFETFTDNLEPTLDKVFETNPFLVTGPGSINVKLSQWSRNDKTSTEGSKIANLNPQRGIKHIINQSINILNNSSSCIEFLLT